MIVGHFGPAFAAKGRIERVPVGAFVLASFAPDVLRVLLSGAGLSEVRMDFYSHAWPANGVLAVITMWIAWKALDDVPAALVMGALVASHIALDMLSGNKLLWRGGPRGLSLELDYPVEIVIETCLLWSGWFLMRRPARVRHLMYLVIPIALTVGESAYLKMTFSRIPHRCIGLPFRPCEAPRRFVIPLRPPEHM